MLSQAHAPRDFTWAELERLVLQSAALIQHAASGNLKMGDPVATWLPNSLAWITVDLACQWMGWLHVALDTRLPARMASELIEHSRARLLVLDQDANCNLAPHLPKLYKSALEESPTLSNNVLPSAVNIDQHHPAQLMYTSGTIGKPKGAVLSHRNLLSNARAKLAAAPQSTTDVRLNILPFAHAYARTCELSTWILSGSQLCIAEDWDALLHWAPAVQPTLINLVPHLVYRLVERLDVAPTKTQLLGSRLRLLQVGGAALRQEVWQRMAALGWPPLQGYGLTETSPVICSNRAGQQRYDTVGPPVDGVEIRIDNENVLWTRGPHVMLGYWQDESATREKIQDGWFCTGDLAEQMDDGSLRIIGRVDDQITLSTGYKVAPLELTRRLSADPWVECVVLVGQDRPFVGALVYPRLANVPSHFIKTGFNGNTLDEQAFTQAQIERWRPLTNDLPRSMQIERVAVMPSPLTVDNGGLNFKGAIRRNFIEQQLFRAEVERLFTN